MTKGLEQTPDGLARDAEFGPMLAAEAGRLARYARRLTGGGADADDLLQDTMLRCWAARRSFRPGSNFIGWTRAVMRNSFLSERRRGRFHIDLPEGALDRLLAVAGTQELSVHLDNVNWALGELTPEHRDAVLLASEGMSIEESAARLAIAEGTFKSRVWRARAQLRNLIESGDAFLRAQRKAETARTKPRKRRDWRDVRIG